MMFMRDADAGRYRCRDGIAEEVFTPGDGSAVDKGAPRHLITAVDKRNVI